MTRDELFDEVILNLDAPIGKVTFTAALEEYYRTFRSEERRRALLVAATIGLVILWLFVLITWATGDDIIVSSDFLPWLAVMASINTLVLATMAVFLLVRSHRVLDATLQITLTIMAAMVCISVWIDRTATGYYGLFAFLLMPLACSTLAPLLFRQALTVTVFADLFFAVLLSVKPGLDGALIGQTALLSLSVSAMALWANWRTDRGERAAFLFLTRERLLSDRSRRRTAELLEMSIVDPLTGIANRRAFEDRFARLATLRRLDGETMAVMMVDIDHFKAFNDHYGHIEGDRCLQRVAQTLAGEMRGPDDFVARLGGEEFVVLAPGIGRAAGESLVERLRRAIERLGIAHEGIAGAGGVVTVSIGCTIATVDGMADPRRVLIDADRALYAAKHGGRNCWRIAEDLGGGPSIGQPPTAAMA